MKRFFCFCLAAVLLISFSSCNVGYEKYTDYTFDFFDTSTTIIGYEKDESVFKANCEKIKEKLKEYHQLYTIYNRYDGINNLYAINNSQTPLKVDERIIQLLEFSKEMYYLTNGKVNAAMGSVLSIWHEYRTDGLEKPINAQLPDNKLLQTANNHTNIENIKIKDGTVFLSDPEMSVDVGAVAKGYAAQQIAIWMKNEDITGYLLNIGGNIRVVGARPDGKKWQIGLENPDTDNEDEPYIEFLELGEMSMVTSGSYQRFYSVDGKNYHHIIDPETLMPAKGFKMVSIITESSALADALSTALFCMDQEDGERLVNSLDNTYALWVTDSGEKIYSNGFKKFLKANEFV